MARSALAPAAPTTALVPDGGGEAAAVGSPGVARGARKERAAGVAGTPGNPGGKKARRFGRLLATPAVLSWVLIGAIPLLFIVANSFADSSLGRPLRAWVGLENYREVLADADAVASLFRTAFYALGVTAFSVVAGTALAVAVFSGWRQARALRVALLVPLFIPPVVVGLIFKLILNPEGGLLAVTARGLGLPAPAPLSDPATALIAVGAADAWEWTPLVFLLVLTALLGTDGHVLEAARLDGAHGLSLFKAVLWPAIAGTVAAVALIRLVLALKVFDLITIMTSGGPGQSTTVSSYAIHRMALREFDLGRAAVLTLLLAVLVTAITLPLVRLNARLHRTEEEA